MRVCMEACMDASARNSASQTTGPLLKFQPAHMHVPLLQLHRWLQLSKRLCCALPPLDLPLKHTSITHKGSRVG